MAAEKREAELDQLGTVALSFVRNRADEGAVRTTNLFQGFRNAVLAHDGDILFSFQFADGLHSTQRARIGSRGNQDPAIFRVTAKEIQHELTALITQTSGVHTDEKFRWNFRQF